MSTVTTREGTAMKRYHLVLIIPFLVTLGCLTVNNGKAVAVPTPRPTQNITVENECNKLTDHYSFTQSFGSEEMGGTTVTAFSYKKSGDCVVRFGAAEDQFYLVTRKNGDIHFDFGTDLIGSSPLFPISAGETRRYAMKDTGSIVDLVAEANEPIVVGNTTHETLRLHVDLPTQDGDLLEVRLWLTKEGRLIRYERTREKIFDLTWVLQEEQEAVALQ